MIRFAEKADREKVIDLWKQCFPGDHAFRVWFFETIYDPSVTLVDEENGVLCAMVQMLPYQLKDERGIRSVTYIYGACTAPDFRRQHRMDQLLQASFALDMQQGRAASILIPQEEWLYGFYEQFGYQTAFYLENSIYHRDNTMISGEICRLSSKDIPMMQALYESCSDMRLLRSEKDWQNQIALFQQLGIGIYGLKQAGDLCCYAFVWQDDADKLWAQEICGSHQKELAQGILTACGCQSIRLTTAGAAQRLGCIRYHDDTPVKPGYFNLLFN